MRQVLVHPDKPPKEAATAKAETDEITRRVRELQAYKGEKQS